MTIDFNSIAQQISLSTGKLFKIEHVKPVSGGDINTAFCLQAHNRRYFVKLNRADLLSMFSAEFSALQELAKTNTVCVPKPIVYGQTNNHAFLVLDYLELNTKTKQAQQLLGRQLAQLHKIKQAFFGWHQNNTIGSTLQINSPCDDWLIFWQDYRLGYQLKLAKQNGYQGKLQTLGEKLSLQIPMFFKNYTPQASLLHGDLWGGNWAVTTQAQAIIFDPASYYGDRETDIAMTELFGGFSTDFYSAYDEVWALNEDYKIRKDFYNLYHILNHLNLFGGGYLHQAEQIMTRLLAEI
ncbi:MAG: fructosamine kinase family protein [Methylococcaceae bacterium]